MAQIVRKVFAMGGGGFLMEPENPLLDAHLISLAGKPRPKICFVGTAGGDNQDQLDRFYLNMKKHNVEPSHLSLFKGPVGSLRDYVFDKDIMYVGGGNTRNLMVLWQEWELDKVFREAYQAGKVMGGISAGSLCWFEQGVTDSIPGKLSSVACMGVLKGSNCPHYSEEPDRRPSYHRLIAEGMKDGLACDDGVAAYFENEQLVELVSSRPKGMGYLLAKKGNEVTETKLQPRYLG